MPFRIKQPLWEELKSVRAFCPDEPWSLVLIAGVLGPGWQESGIGGGAGVGWR